MLSEVHKPSRTLNGTGVAQVAVTPTAAEYGGWIIGTTSPDQDFFLRNGSGGSITLTNVVPGGGATQEATFRSIPTT